MRRLCGIFALWCTAQTALAADLSDAEKAAFVDEVQRCWSVFGLSEAAQNHSVTLAFQLDRDATPIRDSLRLIGAGKDTRPFVKEAYGAARRAVLRCGANGFMLPLEKYAQWHKIEMTFSPERMQMR